MTPSLRHPARVGLLVLLALAANAIPLSLPGEAKLFLGPFLYMPLVLALRLPWAALAAAVPMAGTLATLGHPFALFLATAEALWLGFALRHSRRPALLLDAVFWLVLGVPAIVILYRGIPHMPGELVAIVAGKQCLNQLAAVGIAGFLLRHTRLGSWIEDRTVSRRRVRDIVFHSIFVLAMVPLALVGVGVSALLWAYCERGDREVLTETSERLSQQLELFLASHEAAVVTVANTLGRGGGDAAVLLEELRRAHPTFITMLVADATGRLVAAAPGHVLPAGAAISVADREYFRRARDLDRVCVSGVFRGRGFGRDLLVAISAPVRDAQGRFAGIVEGSLEVHKFAASIVGPHHTESIDLTFADPSGRVIFSNAGDIAPLQLLRHFPQGALLTGPPSDDPVRFDHVDATGRPVRYTAAASHSPRGLVVVAQRPLLAGLDGSGWVFALFGALGLGIVVAAIWVTRRARRQTAEPLEHFAQSANRQAALQTVAPIETSSAGVPYEVWMVFHAFNRLATELQASYAALRRTNAELDQRVIARTAEAEAARQQAEAANKSKSDFLAMTSHEIRTPLNAIIGLSESLAESTRDATAAGRLRTIRTSGQRLLNVVNDLLDLSRVEAGKLELQPAPAELGAICRDVEALFALRAQQQGLRFDTEIAVGLPLWIEIDGPRLQQVLINLVGNALKFTHAGRICLRVEPQPAAAPAPDVALRFSVIDTGPGIPADQQAKLFQPYVQLPGSIAAPTPGTGLGLFISRRLVELFGGVLTLRSETGVGTEFYFTIRAPRAAAPAVPPPPMPVPAAPESALPRVLAADDNIANQEVLRSILEVHCAELVVVDHAAAALAQLEHSAFDVALIDLEMPDADGFSVASTVRAWTGAQASRGCRLVAFSAHSRDQVWTQCAASGFDAFVEKPIDRKELLRAIREPATATRLGR